MNISRSGATYTLLTNGKVLVVGGFGPGTRLATAELYDPHTGTFVLAADMVDPRVLHTATLLKDGRVLITGGIDHVAAVAQLPPVPSCTILRQASSHLLAVCKPIARSTPQLSSRVEKYS